VAGGDLSPWLAGSPPPSASFGHQRRRQVVRTPRKASPSSRAPQQAAEKKSDSGLQQSKVLRTRLSKQAIEIEHAEGVPTKNPARGRVDRLILVVGCWKLLLEVGGLVGGEAMLECGHVCGVGGLLALHRVDGDLVKQLKLGKVALLVGTGGWKFDPLGQEILGGFILDFLSVGLFVDRPTNDLILVLCRCFGEFRDLGHGFLDGGSVLLEFAEFGFVAVDAAWHLAMSQSVLVEWAGGKRGNGNACGEDS
jgi:hypothetical protein